MIEIHASARAVAKKLLKILLVLEGFLLFADIFLNHYKWIPSRALRRAINITREDSLSNWFQSTQTFFIGVVAFFISTVDTSSRKSWLFFAGFFMFLGIDDASKLHERMGTAFKRKVQGTQSLQWLSDFSSYYWQLILGPFFCVVGFYILFFMYKQFKLNRLMKQCLLALTLLAIAVLVDFIEGMNVLSLKPHLHFMKAFEETIEMIAMSVFLCTFLEHFLSKADSIHWRNQDPS